VKAARVNHRLSGVYAIVNEEGPDPVRLAQAIVDGRVCILQYRAKKGIVLEHARALREITAQRGGIFIVNDDWHAALELDADGAHLGPGDAQPSELPMVRARMRGKILGLSCGTLEEARRAQLVGADYIGVGSVFATGSKLDAGDAIGLATLSEIVRAVKLPVCAIGGLDETNIADVRATGAAMAAMISAFARAKDPAQMAAQLVARWRLSPSA